MHTLGVLTLTLAPRKCDLIWKYGLCRSNQTGHSRVGWALIHLLVSLKLGHRDRCAGALWRWRQIEVMNAKNCQQPPEAWRDQGYLPLEP